MIVQIMSIADLLTVAVIVILQYNLLPWNIGVAAALYLTIKWYMFRGDIASFIDLFVGVYIVLLMIGAKILILSIIFSIYLIQKAVFGLIKM
ncbi:hypothetical protein GOV08_03335 [Candidatus Woesearchaeota archaeon]|nr:hypothetical protein [Candidatus Woesearchaeota archaeon]